MPHASVRIPSGVPAVAVTQYSSSIRKLWLDDPGSFYLYAAGEVIDSLQQNWEFTSKVCNRFGICTKVNWYEIIIVDSGSSLDFAESSAGLGPGPSPF